MKLVNIEKLKSTSGADGFRLYRLSKWNPLKWIFLKRLKLMIGLFPKGMVYEKLLEIGYGSGVLIPEFLKHCVNYYGIDIHDEHQFVDKVLLDGNKRTIIGFGDICDCPYPDNMFDCVVALSIFEHIRDIEKAVRETARVMKENGVLLVGFPIENILSNFILDIVKIVIGFDRKVHHPTNHFQILNCLEKTLVNEKSIYYPFNALKYNSLFYCGIWTKSHGKR